MKELVITFVLVTLGVFALTALAERILIHVIFLLIFIHTLKMGMLNLRHLILNATESI